MLNFLSSDNEKQIVGFSLTPGIGLEAVVLDKTKTKVLKYGKKKVDYNFAQRNIQNYGQFKTALVELIDELKISPKSFAYLVLPNVYFNFIEIAYETPKQGIELALTSTAEEYYIFQKEEPVVGWCEVANLTGNEQKKLAYSAFQKSDIAEIKEIFSDLDLKLTGIESAYSATLRGLNITGLTNDAVMMDSSWSVLLVNTNSFTLFQLEGKYLIDCNEIPLAIKSFSPEEAYQAIISSASQLLANYTTSDLFIISQTDDISAEALKKLIQFDKKIIAVDSNKYSKKSLLEVQSASNFNDINSMTFAAIGAADTKNNFSLVLNILKNDPNASMGVYFQTNIFGSPVDITQDYVQKASLALTIIVAIFFGILIGLFSLWKTNQQNEISELDSAINSINMQIQEASKDSNKNGNIDITTIIDEIANKNVTAINFYDSISTDIPKNVWLTKYYNTDGDKIAINGIAESIVDIYEYYKNLRIVSPQSNIKLTELRVITNPYDEKNKDLNNFMAGVSMDEESDRLYSFAIANTDINIISENKNDKDTDKDKDDDSNILINPNDSSLELNNNGIEQPSKQMRPAQ